MIRNRFLFLCIAFVLYAGTAKADSLKDLLGGDLGNLGNALGNMAQETIAQNKDLKIYDPLHLNHLPGQNIYPNNT